MKLASKVSLIALALSASSAFAADLSTLKAPVVAAPSPTWTGFHAGLNAGATWGNNMAPNGRTWNMWSGNDPLTIDRVSQMLLSGSSGTSGSVGFIGGGQVGYDWQFPVSGMGFVIGVEADIQGVAGAGNNLNRGLAAPGAGVDFGEVFNAGSVIFSNQQISSNLNWLGTVRGRLGYLVTPALLLYGTGGLSYGQVSGSMQNNQAWTDTGTGKGQLNNWYDVYGRHSYSNTQVGWTAGGGVEWMFMQNWSAKAEYLYYDLGNITGTVWNPGVSQYAAIGNALQSVTTYSGRVSGNIVRAGVNYHFNFAGAPVVAKF